MGDLLKNAFAHITQSTGNAAGEDLVLTGTSLGCTVLSVSITNVTTTDTTFSMYIRDGDAAGATNVYRLYQTQSLPAKSTFIHNTKLVINTTDTLNLIEASNNGATFDVVVSYLEQT
jgi:hypothetical protein